MLIGTSKFFKENKIARTRWASAICSLWKNLQELITPNCREVMFLPVSNVQERGCHRKSRQTKFWKRERAICNFSLAFMRMHSFSANQKRVFFSCLLLCIVGASHLFCYGNPMYNLCTFFFIIASKADQCRSWKLNQGIALLSLWSIFLYLLCA